MEPNNSPVASTPTSERTLATSASFVTGAVLLILAIFIAGFYLMNAGVTNDSHEPMDMMGGQMPSNTAGGAETAATESATAEATAAFSTQSSSDELGSIEADLEATNLGSLDGVDQI